MKTAAPVRYAENDSDDEILGRAQPALGIGAVGADDSESDDEDFEGGNDSDDDPLEYALVFDSV